jgi:hypothetical protein
VDEADILQRQPVRNLDRPVERLGVQFDAGEVDIRRAVGQRTEIFARPTGDLQP